MQSLRALSLAPSINDWLANSRHPRILHVFDRACNLINEHSGILSIVTSEIGNGPFNLVIETDLLFVEHLSLETPVSTSANQLSLGNLTIHITDAIPWNPRPDWELLHSKKDEIVKRLTQLPIIAEHPFGTNYFMQGGLDTPSASASGYSTTSILKFSNPLISSLSSALAAANISTAKILASQLAGLGQGLTPSGDDFIMGALHAAWILHPPEVAKQLTEEIANTATPLTTSLSAAWIRSAGRGEAGELWHQLFDTLVAGDEVEIQKRVKKILAVGETSGADALAGFVDVFENWERMVQRIR